MLEPCHNGLVTSRDPLDLSEGELQQADEAYYLPNVRAIQAAPGTSELAAVPITSLHGLAYMDRDAGTDYLIAHADDDYLYLAIGSTGNWTALSTTYVTVQVGSAFDATQLGGTIVLVNGTARPIATADPTSAVRYAGMQAVTTAPTLFQTGVGTWVGATATYWFWTTESDSVTGYESSFSGTPFTRDMTNGLGGIVLQRPAIVNPEATHWKLYRSAATASSASYDNPFPIGYLVSTTAIGSTIAADVGTQDFTIEYPSLTVEIAGVVASVSRNGPPPTADACEVFENSLVVNDISDKSRIWYTYPDTVWAWPSIYFVNLETPQQDNIVKLKRVRRVLLAFMREQVIRFNYLPRESDAEFDRGRVWDLISDSHGLVGPRAIATITPEGQEPLVVFLSRAGLFSTDGFQVEPVVADINWAGLIAAPEKAVLQDIPALGILALFYTPAGATKNTKALFFHYHSSHRKQSGLKATGPATLSAFDAAYVYSDTLARPLLALLSPEGKVSYFDQAPAPNEMVLTSRQFLPHNTPDGRSTIERLWVRHQAAPGTLAASLVSYPVNEGMEHVLPAAPFTPAYAGYTQLDMRRYIANAYAMRFQGKAAIEHWILEMEELG